MVREDMTMKEVSKDRIVELASDFAERDVSWHFHILTPECQLNDSDRYALVLENATDEAAFVACSDEPYMDVGKQLVKLLHGADVVREGDDEKGAEGTPSASVAKILERGRELMEANVYWHHHMLFPDCIYNRHQDKWTIVFEDMEAGEIIESVTKDEPKGDLKLIETLFYSQKR